MNDLDNISFLAQANAKQWGRPRRLEEIQTNIPYFQISKSDLGKWTVKGYNYEGHDNAPRMMLWEYYLTNNIFPQISKTHDITGYYNIELHDSYTYLDNGKDYRGCLTFSKFKTDSGPILIPDPYAQQNWGNTLNGINDSQEWRTKIPKVCFAGTTTGARDPAKNERINMCIWSLARPDLYDFKITKIAQMEAADVHKYLGEGQAQKIVSPPISPQEQMKYKYHLMLDGNTCRFDVWNFMTNSVTLKYQSQEMLWYYPLLQNNIHYVEVNRSTMESAMRLEDGMANLIIANAKIMAKRLVNPITHIYYLKSVFEEMAQQK